MPSANSRQLTVIEALDFNCEHTPDHPFYLFSPNLELPNTTITHLEFTRATYRAANSFLHTVDGAPNQKVVCLFAVLDSIAYQAITAGLLRAGLIPFPISPRLSVAAIAHLLKTTSCHWIITTHESLGSLIVKVQSELSQANPSYELSATEAPGLKELFPKLGYETSNDSTHRPSSHQTLWNDIALYLHSSGSTGLPKAIPLTHRALAEWASYEIMTIVHRSPVPIKLSGIGLPAFHTLGIYMQLLYPVYGLIPVAMYPPVILSPKGQPILPTPDNILDHLRRTGSNGLITIPAMLHAWGQSPEAINLLKTFVFVGFSGGPVSKKVGNYLTTSGVNLKTIYGGTEFGAPSLLKLTRGEEDDWEWVEFSPKAKIRWVDEGEGKFECQFLTSEAQHPSVENIYNPNGYATSDVFERHSSKPYLWRITGRKDDVIIHSSGEKTVPGPMEEIISSSPFVGGTIIFGREHDQTGVLIEPLAGHIVDPNIPNEVATYRNEIWSVIEEANSCAPAFSRIFKEMILVASPSKPLPRSAKGTVVRKQALALYATEITDLYKVVETSKGQDVVPPENWNESTIQSWIFEQICDLLPGRQIEPATDLFDQGFDSLNATFLRLRIIGALKSSKSSAEIAKLIEQNVIYAHPTIISLANFIFGLVRGQKSQINRVALIEQMIEKHSKGLLDLQIPHYLSPLHGDAVVLITGTTGNLGAQLLANLLLDGRVKRIFALNRRSPASTLLERHKERFEDKGLGVDLLNSAKLTLLEGDTSEENLGLNPDLYEELRTSLNVIMHIAWRLDFNLSLSSFEPSIRGIRRLIDLARSSSHASSLRFLFTSSVSVAQSWDKRKGRYPENVVTDARYAVGGGYGEGKYVSERLLAMSGLNAFCLRIGQVSGGLPNGAWATTDWVPILIKSSLALGALPTSTGVVSWIPMDAVCDAIIDISFTDGPSHLVSNLVHTRPITWNAAFGFAREALEEIKPDVRLDLIPMAEWITLLEARSMNSSESTLRALPAIKLLDFFRTASEATSNKDDDESGGLANFRTDNAQRASMRMRNLSALDYEDVVRWVKYWDMRGLFTSNE